jgi:hypothetical protein
MSVYVVAHRGKLTPMDESDLLTLLRQNPRAFWPAVQPIGDVAEQVETDTSVCLQGDYLRGTALGRDLCAAPDKERAKLAKRAAIWPRGASPLLKRVLGQAIDWLSIANLAITQ